MIRQYALKVFHKSVRRLQLMEPIIHLLYIFLSYLVQQFIFRTNYIHFVHLLQLGLIEASNVKSVEVGFELFHRLHVLKQSFTFFGSLLTSQIPHHNGFLYVQLLRNNSIFSFSFEVLLATKI